MLSYLIPATSRPCLFYLYGHTEKGIRSKKIYEVEDDDALPSDQLGFCISDWVTADSYSGNIC